MDIQVGGSTVSVALHPEFSCYATSEDGRVFARPALPRKGRPRSGPSLRADHWVEIAQFIVRPKYTPPYWKCRVTQDGKTKLVSVHRFMLECWKGVEPRTLVVRHLDGNSLNNTLSNLMYGTVKQNVDDAFRHNGNYAEGSRNGRARLTEQDVLAIRARYDEGEAINTIALDYPQVHKVSVSNAAKRITWGHL